MNRYILIVSTTGHAHAWEWCPRSVKSMRLAHSAIQAAAERGELTFRESAWARLRVEQTSEVPLNGLFGWVMGFFGAGVPADHDQAILELTQEGR